MATITTKYEVGSRVWVADWKSLKAYRTCPDCHGTKEWQVTTPDGEEFTIGCQTCRNGYHATGRIMYYTRTPTPWHGTIGSIQLDTADPNKVRYMLEETGVGSGTLWSEDKLVETAEEAERIAAADIARLEAEAKEQQENERQRRRHDHIYVQKREKRLRDEMAKVINLLLNVRKVDEYAPPKLLQRVERALVRNAKFKRC